MRLTDEDWLNIEREECAHSLSFFIQRAWAQLEPSQPYTHGWHIDALAEHLAAVTSGEINRLLINIPPGTMKSMMTSVFWPAWEWGPKQLASKRIIGASHEMGLATRDSMNMRRLITSEWYQKLWPTPLVGDQNQKTYFQNSEMGWRQACAVSSMTGRRGDCLTGNVLICTDIGQLSIKEIVDHAKNCNVLSYDNNTDRLVYRPIKAVARSSSSEIYRVHTACGSVVECTGDHKFYTARGYVAARFLSSDDFLLSAMPKRNQKKRLSIEEKRKTRDFWDILQSFVLNNLYKYSKWKNWPILQCMQQKDKKRKSSVFRRVRGDSKKKKIIMEKIKFSHDRMRNLRERYSTNYFGLYSKILFGEVCKLWTFFGYAWRKQSSLAWRSGCKKIRFVEQQTISKNEKRHYSTRWEYVRLLSVGSKTSCPSHGYGYIKQYLEKFNNTLSKLPCFMAQQKKIETKRTAIALVERISKSEMVYDIQVDDTECFFANGILVHNCVIWDDPHSVEDSHSQAAMDEAERVFRETLPTRLNNPDRSAIIIVMQRLAENDISGIILSNDFGYEHLCLPMEYEPKRHCSTKIGFNDPRTSEGELLFPARFPRHVVDRDRAIMGTKAAEGQFQQRPSPRGGELIRSEWFKRYSMLPPMDYRIIYADTAQKTKEHNDYSVFECWGRAKDGSGIYLIDLMRGKWEAPELKRRALEFWLKHKSAPIDTLGGLRQMKVEDKASGTGLIQELKTHHDGTYIPIAGIQRNRDKYTRLLDVLPQIEAGFVHIPDLAPWVSDFVTECERFTADDSHMHDDQIDPMIDAINDMCQNSTTNQWLKYAESLKSGGRI